MAPVKKLRQSNRIKSQNARRVQKKKRNSLKQSTKKKEQNRIRVQAYRERIKNDPEKYKNYCENRRKRYLAAKEKGHFKSRDAMTERELRIVRRKERDNKRKSRMKKREEKATEENENIEIESEFVLHQRRSGEKRKYRMRRQCYQMNTELREKNAALNKSIQTLKKKIQRLNIKSKKSNSPAAKVKKFLNQRSIPKDVEERLISNKVLVDQITSNYVNSDNNLTKISVKNILTGHIIKKYRKQTFLQKQLNISMRNVFGKNANNQRILNKNTMKETVKDVLINHSILDPGKKACITRNKRKYKKRYITASFLDLHKKFVVETGLTVSYKTFCRFRPFYIMNPVITARNTCACISHENFKLLLKALHNDNIVKENSLYEVIENTLCNKERTKDCYFRKCLKCKTNTLKLNLNQNSQTLNFKKWIKETEKRISAKTKKEITVNITKKSDFTVNLDSITELISTEFNNILQHDFRASHQQKILKEKRNNLQDNEGFLLLDFSENFLCKYNTEVQAVHFGASRKQISLHTGVFYSKDFKEGFSACSEHLDHSACAVTAHIIIVLKSYLLQFPNISTLNFMSDSPSTQYRNKTVFYFVTQHITKLVPQINAITYNFTESGHGKRPADGIGAVLKRVADKIIAYGQDIINFESFMQVLQERISSIKLFKAIPNDIKEIETILPDKLQQFKGTMSVHQFTWNKSTPGDVFFNTLSCFECAPGVPCNHFFINKLSYILGKPGNSKRNMIKHEDSTKKKKNSVIVKKIETLNRPVRVIRFPEANNIKSEQLQNIIKSSDEVNKLTHNRPIRVKRLPAKLLQ